MDTRRTILWMIFSFSLLLLWNNWQVHNGQPSLFGLGGNTVQTDKSTTQGATADGSVPAHAAATPSTPAAAPGTGVPAQEAEQAGQQVQVTTDVFDLTFDTRGAQLVRAELLKYKALD